MYSVLVFQAEGEVVDWFSIVWVRITLLQHLYCCAQIWFCLVEASAAQVPESQLIVAAVVERFAAQCLLVVVECRPCGVAVLLQV